MTDPEELRIGWGRGWHGGGDGMGGGGEGGGAAVSVVPILALKKLRQALTELRPVLCAHYINSMTAPIIIHDS